jgi:SAM-dependent methyltransferase
MDNAPNIEDRLDKRIQANAGGARDVNAFLMNLADVRPEDRVLDLGCGNGHQVVPLASCVASITAVDISRERLDELAHRLEGRGRVECLCIDMDYAPGALEGRRFDLIEAIYSIYYSEDIRALVQAIARRLVALRGRFLTLSPDVGNNAEWFDDLNCVFPVPEDILATQWTSQRRVLPHVRDFFRDVQCVPFENAIRYTDLDALMSYYDGCGHYCPTARRSDAAAFFGKRFRTDGSYTIAKRALAIVGREPK